MTIELFNPDGLEKPVGYSHAAKVTAGKLVFVAGQAPFDAAGALVGKGDFVAQFGQVAANLKLVIESAGGRPEQYVALTMYVTDMNAYRKNRKPIGIAYREIFGNFFPAVTLVEVKSLYHPDCLLEISGIAAVD